MGEEAKDCEREESEGGTKGLASFWGGFEVEALASIAQEERVEQGATCRSHEPSQNASRLLRVFEPSRRRTTDTMRFAFLFSNSISTPIV
jgi:hypothetical protein